MISRREMRECAEREVRQRKRVYPRWVATGRMSKQFADRQIAVMEAIARHFDGDFDEPQGSQFEGEREP